MPRIDVAIGVVRDKTGRILIAKRKEGVHQGGLWEFPGGKFEPIENAQQALKRELYEELNIRIKESTPLININFNYPEHHVRLHVREVCSFEGEPVGQEGQECLWVAGQELGKYEFPEANKAILSAINLGRHYAIIGGNDVQQVLRELDCVSQQGVELVQIRVKGLCELEAEGMQVAARVKCNELGVKYLINSQMREKRSLDGGVHLASCDLMSLKQRPESAGLVAASCHSLQELQRAEQLGLDFVVLAPVMETATHPKAKVLGWRQFTQLVAKVNMPVFALGGVRKQDYQMAVACGAQGISGISLYKY